MMERMGSQLLLNGFDQQVIVKIEQADVALSIEKDHIGDGLYSIFLRDVTIPALELRELGPNHLLLVKGTQPRGFVLVKRARDDVKPAVVILFVNLLEERYLLSARATPRSPEIDERDVTVNDKLRQADEIAGRRATADVTIVAPNANLLL